MPENVQEIFTDRILDPKDPMRTGIDKNGLFELAENIKQNGLINPITIRPVGDMFEVVAGHRRLAACRIAGQIRVACVVRVLDDRAAFRVMAAENLAREEVDPVDESVFVRRYMEQTGDDIAAVAGALRRSAQWVQSRLIIGEMPDYMLGALRNGTLKLGAALALYDITDDRTRRTWVDMAIRDGVSVAQAEYWVHGWKVSQLPGGGGPTNPPPQAPPPAAGPVTFRCAVDGKDYDARIVKTVMIAESNLPVFYEFVKAWRAQPAAEPPEAGSAVA